MSPPLWWLKFLVIIPSPRLSPSRVLGDTRFVRLACDALGVDACELVGGDRVSVPRRHHGKAPYTRTPENKVLANLARYRETPENFVFVHLIGGNNEPISDRFLPRGSVQFEA